MNTLTNKRIELQYDSRPDDLLSTLFSSCDLQDATPIFHDAWSLPDIEPAIDRIIRARDTHEKIMIFGDYDVDGVSSTALLFTFLQAVGDMAVSYRLPNRHTDGYGLKQHFIDDIHASGATLLITVDCGTKDDELHAYAKNLGIDTIVLDHHAIEILPDKQHALAIVNPHRPDNQYPFSDLAAVGVVYKVISALSQKLYNSTQQAEAYVDIACLGTIADCMPLIDENRSIAQLGLQKLVTDPSLPALRHLLSSKEFLAHNADMVGFFLGPIINASGRMDSPYYALQLLLETDPQKITSRANHLLELNLKRKASTQVHIEKAQASVDVSAPILIYSSTDISHGIIGLIAGRLCSTYNKPTIVLADDGVHLTASCRSPHYLSMIDTISHFHDRLVSYGGHDQAAGFTIHRDAFAGFQKDITTHVAQQIIDVNTQPVLPVVCELPFEDISDSFVTGLMRLAPFGQGNPRPRFMTQLTNPSYEYLGNEQHLRIIPDIPLPFRLPAFGLGAYKQTLEQSQKICCIYEIDMSCWKGKIRTDVRVVDIMILDSKVSEQPADVLRPQ